MTTSNGSTRFSLFKDAFKAAKAEKSVLLASTFRSGSTFVASLLRANGMNGLNLEKYNEMWKYVNAPDEEFYESCLNIAETTEDGVFTSKIMWPHRNNLANGLRNDRKHSADFADAFPAAKWIFVCRANKVKQGISFWRAKKSKRWHVQQIETEPVIEYNYKEIKSCYDELLAHDQFWEDFFIQASIVPFRVNYEEFLCNVETQLKNLLEYIGEYRTNSRPFTTSCNLKKQSDSMSEEYYERFLEDSYG